MANTTTKGTTSRSSKATRGKKPAKATAAAASKSRAKASAPARQISADSRQQMIAKAAYLRAERRGFGSGDPLDDWLAAEREIDTLLAQRAHPIAH